MARLQNSYAVRPNDPLTSLINTTTGQIIEDVPVDSQALSRMNGTPR